MLFHNFDFTDTVVTKKFEIDQIEHKATWQYYYENYCCSINELFDQFLEQNNSFNPRAHALMFLFRHSLELCFKYNLHLQSDQIPLSHSFPELETAFSRLKVPDKFKELIRETDFDDDGGCYRYLQDKNGNTYFTISDRIELAKILEKYESCLSAGFVVNRIVKPFDYHNKRLQWDLTLHMGECDRLGHIRTQYDLTIEAIIEGVILGNFSINNFYLPFLFLIRHSLELALKNNIHELQLIGILKPRNINNEHSLATLYNVYDKFLDDIDTRKLPLEIVTKLNEYRKKYIELNSTIHNIDKNSFFFRFPVDREGNAHSINLKKLNLIKILELYYLTDPFITFTNHVLKDNGLFGLVEDII